jgi:putative ABC transport system ATP-binding protein
MIRAEGLVKTYGGAEGGVRALAGLDLTVRQGRFIVVAGANGSGKSTLLGAVAGTVRPDRGRVWIGGDEVTHQPVHQRAPLIGRVFQDPRLGTAPAMTVAENLRLAATRGRPRGLRLGIGAVERRHYRETLAGLGMALESRLDSPASQLSGGQRQALAMLMAVWRTPKVLLLDEHTASLDPGSEKKVLDLTRRMAEERGLTTIAVTHRVDLALALGERTVVLGRGRVAADFDGPARETLTAAELAARMAGGPSDEAP